MTTKEESIIKRLKMQLIELKQVDNCDDFYDWQNVTLHTLERVFPNNKLLLENFENIEAYDIGDVMNEDEGEDIHQEAKIQAFKMIVGVIRDIEALGLGEKPNGKGTQVNVTNNIEQKVHQQVEQQIEIKLKFMIEVFKEELTGKQLKELKEIQESNDEPEAKKQRFFDKVKSFGIDVAANLVSGILANPDFIQQLTS